MIIMCEKHNILVVFATCMTSRKPKLILSMFFVDIIFVEQFYENVGDVLKCCVFIVYINSSNSKTISFCVLTFSTIKLLVK